MSDFDLDRLGDVWRQQPDPAEMERLKRSATAVAQRARFAAIIDVCAAIAVAAVVIVLVITNPRIQTVVMGTAAILVLLGSNIRLRKLRRLELKGLTGTTEDMLDQSIARVETTLRHHKVTLYSGPLVLLCSWLWASIVVPRKESVLGSLRDLPWFRPTLLGAAIASVAALTIFLIIFIRRGQRELNRLNAMREAFREESDSSTL